MGRSSRRFPATGRSSASPIWHRWPVYADHHLLIHKQAENGRTFTRIEPLDQRRREEEIARMISGENLTDTALQNAREMLSLAR